MLTYTAGSCEANGPIVTTNPYELLCGSVPAPCLEIFDPYTTISVPAGKCTGGGSTDVLCHDNPIQGGGGNDQLNGGPGSDNLEAGPGNDAVDGGPGDDYLEGIAYTAALAGLLVMRASARRAVATTRATGTAGSWSVTKRRVRMRAP